MPRNIKDRSLGDVPTASGSSIITSSMRRKRSRSSSFSDEVYLEPKAKRESPHPSLRNGSRFVHLGEPSGIALRPKYFPINSPTLTPAQARSGSFSQVGRNFRVNSNLTKSGHSTGYHEAAVTTDTFNFLSSSIPGSRGKRILQGANRNSFFRIHNRTEVSEEILGHVLSLADGFRTDTARTAISASNGMAAGHSGSNLNLTGQSDAHNLLRQKVMDILKAPSNTPGLTKNSIACIFGSMVSSSIAPGYLARSITGGTRSLKDSSFKSSYEQARDEIKSRVNYFYNSLTSAEKVFVDSHSTSFITSTSPRGRSADRYIASGRATSPRRGISQLDANEVSGTGYLSPLAQSPALPTELPPDNINHIGLYFTEPFRAFR